MSPSLRSVSTIGIMGFGAFGRLMARHLQPHFALRIHDLHCPPSPDDGGRGLSPATAAEVAACDLVILAVPVPAIPDAIAALHPHLRAGTVVLDVGSVKIGPARALVEGLPTHVGIVGTHPLFGPQSARNGLAGLKIALCPIRGGATPRIAAFLRHVLKLEVIVTTPDAHDREVAMVQGLTHLIAKILVRMEPLPRRMTTASFDLLMQATDMVRYDAPNVFMAIERANPHAKAVRDRFFSLAEEMRLFLERGHDAAETRAPDDASLEQAS
ncbi:prephenate dehydrogenase [Bosea sp. (in: a-proteobacteria)]|uniref:prephenate dehydrogenase n=1 Tax=Bosea sp. (in: a-proteobacteria) TaxID=1871050 RepID=UPI0011F4132C|nr:prephenate dehydrogenase [Bosea sp. (in: a-proteobacteria)]TAJ33992.1 MAG: prephenate dehydrogenase [Bosea sp. (in: a-proteobacteria)]